MATYEIHYKDGSFERQTGNSITEAFQNTGRKTETGNIDFSILDFFFRVPVPFTEGQITYQLFIMKDKKKNWEPFGKETTNLSALELILKTKVKKEGIFSGLIVNMNTEMPIQWLWSR